MKQASKILVVDDCPALITTIKAALRKEYCLEIARSGEEALEIAPRWHPDIVLLDIMMPGIDGYETCRRIRMDKTLSHTKVIMVSSGDTVANRLEGYEAGADDYITKPFDIEELRAKVNVYLRLKSVEELNNLKTDVLTLLGHETRTPLNGIIEPTELLAADEGLDDDERKMFAMMANRNARRLMAFVEKVISLSTLKSQKWPFEFAFVNLSDVVRDAVSEMLGKAHDMNIRIKERLCTDAPVEIDYHQIKNVIVSLLDNALIHSSTGSCVMVLVGCDDDKVVTSVTDYGEGFDPAFLPHVFDAFSAASVYRKTQGHGLSLAIAREVVGAHNAKISVVCTPGLETVFTIEFSKAAPAKVEKEQAVATCIPTA